MRPIQGHILTSKEDGIAKGRKSCVPRTRVEEIRLSEQVTSEDLVVGSKGAVDPHPELTVIAYQWILIDEVRISRPVGEREPGDNFLGDWVNGRNHVSGDRLAHQYRGPCIGATCRAIEKRQSGGVEKLAAVIIQIGRPAGAAQVDGLTGQETAEVPVPFGLGRNHVGKREPLDLAKPVVISEKEGFALLDWAAKGAPVIVASKLRSC